MRINGGCGGGAAVGGCGDGRGNCEAGNCVILRDVVRRLLLPMVLLPGLAAGGERWVRFRSGPFEVLSAAGERPAREALNELEQVRFVLGGVLGKGELRSVWPVRVVIFDSGGPARGYRIGSLKLVRDWWSGGIVKGQGLPVRQWVQILLESNTARMPEAVERGLLDVFSTARVRANRVTLGAAPSEPTKDWARMHLLVVSPEYSGRVRVLFSNFEQGADWYAAYKNAFEKTPKEMEAEVDAYLAAGRFPEREFSGAAMSIRDFRARDYDAGYIDVALADLLEGEAARAAYAAVIKQFGELPEALEGLERYREAVQAGSRSARCWVEHGRRLKDAAAAREAFVKAAELNPGWAEPYFRMAEIDTTLAVKARNLEKATELAPRHGAYWQALAETYEEAKNFRAAGKAWTGAERAAADESERERLRQVRRAIEQKRAEHKAAERRRQAEELEQLRERMMQAIREAEQRVGEDDPKAPAGRKIYEWWDDPRPRESVSGMLTKIDCLGAAARLAIETSGGQVKQLLVRDPSQVVLTGVGEKTLGCGPQKPARPVSVEYYSETDAKLKTAGEVIMIEFR